MAIHWRLKTYLATKHGIYRISLLQKLIVKKTGVLISAQNLSQYLKAPKTLRLTTIEILCSALECELNDFCTVAPASMKPEKVRKLSFQNTPLSKRATKHFPNPADYS